MVTRLSQISVLIRSLPLDMYTDIETRPVLPSFLPTMLSSRLYPATAAFMNCLFYALNSCNNITVRERSATTQYIVSSPTIFFYQSGQLARSSMKCVAFITPAVTVIAHGRSAECRLPVCQTACYAEQPGPLCSTTAALHILHSIAYRPPVVALSVQRRQQQQA